MTQEELLKLGFIDLAQYEAAKNALETNAPAFGSKGFCAANWNPLPQRGADYSRPCYENAAAYPAEIDLTAGMPPVYNQGARGTCMANAVVALVEYFFENKYKLSRQFFYWAMKHEDGSEERLRKWLADPLADDEFVSFFGYFLKKIKAKLADAEKRQDANSYKYYASLLAKSSDGNLTLSARGCTEAKNEYRETFAGAGFETAFKTLRKFGICRDELMEYVSTPRGDSEAQSLVMDRELEEEIMRDKLLDARTRIPDNLQLVSGASVDTYKRILSGAGGKRPMPLVIGVQTFCSLNSEYASNTGWFSLPLYDDKNEGGHAMLAVGYKDTPIVPGGGYFIVRNSWGSNWAWNYKDNAHRGYARIPYAYIENFAYPAAITIVAEAGGAGNSDGGWPPKKDKLAKYIQTATKMMKNRKGLFNIAKGASIIVDPVTGKVDKDTPENRKAFVMNGYSWEPMENQGE